MLADRLVNNMYWSFGYTIGECIVIYILYIENKS